MGVSLARDLRQHPDTVNIAAKRGGKLIKAHEGPGDAIAEDKGRSLCPRWMGIYSQGDSKASVQVGERGGGIEQTRGYRRDSIVAQPPYSGAADGKHATATASVATRRVSLARGPRKHTDAVTSRQKAGNSQSKPAKGPAMQLPRWRAIAVPAWGGHLQPW